MRTGGGDFTPEAYEQLKEAYAKEVREADSVEKQGHDIMGLNLGLETMPVDSPWADLIPKDQYPSGKSEYLDGKQDPAEILELMRSSVTKPKPEEEEEEEITDEELDTEIDNILQDEDEVEEDEEHEDEDEEDEEEEEEVIEPVDDLDPEAVAAQIAELRAELEQMSFVPESEDDPEVSDDESE